MSTIAERIRKIIVDQLGADPATIVDEASFADDLGADSLETVQIVMEIEEEFGVEIPDSAASTILTVGDAIRFVEKTRRDRRGIYPADKAATGSSFDALRAGR
ncbi:Acyl carrier protein (ACP) (modular protein) [Agrobacterium deltaense NCPPB 1641]|uniref:Acyl carrier protein n=1 Tax=Agrobacterium deltaense NCPPB 1641 TaxID=1183425 RepID=A0A1S7U3D6_9HYPH|nr:Acyl carrier protein (ACP) (modular protein) [Agrobacterium deltaense NCPPB 1641]